MNFQKLALVILVSTLIMACKSSSTNSDSTLKATEAEKVYDQYVANWLDQDSAGLMELVLEDCVLMPSNIPPVMGKDAIQQFWFPNNGSKTTIHTFTSNLISSSIVHDSMAVTVHEAFMDWNYDLDSLHIGKLQRTLTTTIFKKQVDDQWKMWRQSWSNYEMNDKVSTDALAPQ
jgi:ketosteroid isomerase-like protein